MAAEELFSKVSAAVSAMPVGEITGLQIHSYIYSHHLDELFPKRTLALRLMLTPVTSNWRQKLLIYKSYQNTSEDNHAPGASVSSCSDFY